MANLVPKYRYEDAGKRRLTGYHGEWYDPKRRPKRKRISLRTKDKRAARQRLTELERDYAMGTWDPWVDRAPAAAALLVAEAAEEFLKSREARRSSTSTLRVYGYILGSFVRSLAPDMPLYAVEEKHLEGFFGRPLADATRKNYRRRMHTFFKWCVDAGLVKSNPVLMPTQGKAARQRKEPDYLSPAQFDMLLRTVAANDTLKGRDETWFTDVVTIAAYTGLRRAEIVHLDWKHVFLQHKNPTTGKRQPYIKVAHAASHSTKSGRERFVPLVERAFEVVERLRSERVDENPSSPVLRGPDGGRLNPGSLSRRFKHFARLAGLSEGIHFHSLRHTFASWAVQRGHDLYKLKDVLGHADVSQTQVYAKLNPDSLYSEVEKAFSKVASQTYTLDDIRSLEPLARDRGLTLSDYLQGRQEETTRQSNP